MTADTSPSTPPPVNHPPLRTGPDGRLQTEKDGQWITVNVSRCFPWTDPDHFFSLRGDDGREVAFVNDPSQLTTESQTALSLALTRSTFVFEVTRIEKIYRDIELRVWLVDTHQGPRKFETELDSWPDTIPGGGWLIRDVTGDLYRIPPQDKLDAASRKLFWAFLD
jgi:hypothetical protein